MGACVRSLAFESQRLRENLTWRSGRHEALQTQLLEELSGLNSLQRGPAWSSVA